MEKYKRLCPKCGIVLEYTLKDNRDAAEKKKQFCRKCGCNTPERLAKQRALFSGEKNPFWGKKHSQETISKLKGRKPTPEQMSLLKSGVCAHKGKSNGMYGRSVYSIWFEKYGKEEADKRQAEMSRKKSETAKKNYDPSKHKSPPYGCGNGWGGWYKGWYFRSLLELSYMINIIERNNLSWEKGETSSICILYEENGKVRRYFPDFLIDNKIIEVKPIKLMNTAKNQLKKVAAEKYCLENGFQYEITDAPHLPFEEILLYFNQKMISFDKKTEQKFNKEKTRFNKKVEHLRLRKETDERQRNID